MSPQVKPSIVFAHGIWADGSCFNKVIPALQAEGYEVASAQYAVDTNEVDVAATLRTLGRSASPATWSVLLGPMGLHGAGMTGEDGPPGLHRGHRPVTASTATSQRPAVLAPVASWLPPETGRRPTFIVLSLPGGLFSQSKGSDAVAEVEFERATGLQILRE